jgi:cytochrome c-type biogenesis protein CcmH/NrfG
MKRVLIFSVVLLFFLIGCEKKEQQKSTQPPFSGPAQSRGQLQGQIQMLQDTVTKNPQDVRAWIQFGNLLMDSARFPEAIDAYQKALNLAPGNVDVMVDMGTCYRNTGQPQKAVEAYRKALAINPNHLNAHRNLGVVSAFDLGDRKTAVHAFEEYLRLGPNAQDAAQVRQLIANLKSQR